MQHRGRCLALTMKLATTALASLLALSTAWARANGLPHALPPQLLADALEVFSETTGLQILYSPELTRGIRSHGAAANESTQKALRDLLSDTGLTFEFVNPRTVTLRSLAEPAGAGNGSAPTAAVQDHSLRVAQADQGSPTTTSVSAPQQQSSESLVLEEIVVTAQKRSERLIDTPQSVTVIGSNELNKLGAVQFSDIASSIAGLSFTSSGVGHGQISLRGVTSFSPNSTVGVYVDDVAYGSSSAFASGASYAFDSALFDLSRIEVLRGPQGTLYGASTMGGLLKYVTNMPDTTQFSGAAQAGTSVTDDGGVSYRANAVVNIPVIGNTLAVRASAFESHEGGYSDDIGLGRKDADRSDVYGGRLDTLFTPTDALRIRLTGFLQNITRDANSVADYSLQGAPLYGSLEQSRKLAEPFHQQFRLGSLNIGYHLGPSSLTSITSYQSLETQEHVDQSGLAALLNPIGEDLYAAAGIATGNSTDKFTQEIRLSSDAAQTLEYLLGVFYTHEASDQNQSLLLQNPAHQLVPNSFYHFDSPSTYQEYAAFADLTYHLTSRLDISGGIRESHDRQSYADLQTGTFGTADTASDASENVRTYLANARYHLSDDATAYVRYATGYRPGGPNFFVTDPSTGQSSPPTFAPDSLKSYEGGIKAEMAGGRVAIDIAGYYIDWSNIQITTYFSNGEGFVNNAPNVHIQGSELSITARPLNELLLTGAFAYQHAYLSEVAPSLGGMQGERVPNVPRFSGSLNADYTFIELPWQPSVGATLKRISERTTQFGALGTAANYLLPGYTTLDLRSGVVLGSLNLQLYARNLLNQRGQSSGLGEGTYEQVSLIEPLTVGVAALVHF